VTRRAAALATAALAAALALPALPFGFVYDDVLLIRENPLVHTLGRAGEIWSSSYWPAGLLYRPLTIQLFAVEWAIGGGSPLAFHLFSAVLAAGAALAALRLYRQVLPGRTGTWWAEPALLGAVLFAVHPVHAEAVASIVGQGELVAGLLALVVVERYLAWRASDALSAGRRLLLALLTLAAILAKETGYVIPLLLGAADLTMGRRTDGQKGRRTDGQKGRRAAFVLQGCAVLAGLLARLAVLGSFAGETSATVWRGLGFFDRAVAMLAIVPDWLRLLFWPARLQAEYGPPALPVTAAPAGLHGLGILILMLGAAGLGLAWRRRPALGFALLWTGIALLPVSNLPAATGIVLAERTLFLPSAGAMLLVAALLRAQPAGRPALLVPLGVLALAALAAVRFQTRLPAWRSQESFFRALAEDAPRTYRAHFVASRYHYGQERFALAEQAARRALALYDRDSRVHEQLGQALRVQGRCPEAIPVLEQGVRLDPAGTTVRSRLIECALAAGDTSRARAAAAEAVELGQREFSATLARLTR